MLLSNVTVAPELAVAERVKVGQRVIAIRQGSKGDELSVLTDGEGMTGIFSRQISNVGVTWIGASGLGCGNGNRAQCIARMSG